MRLSVTLPFCLFSSFVDTRIVVEKINSDNLLGRFWALLSLKPLQERRLGSVAMSREGSSAFWQDGRLRGGERQPGIEYEHKARGV